MLHPKTDPDSGAAFWRLSGITAVEQMPRAAQLTAAVKEAIRLAECGKDGRRRPGTARAVPVPQALAKAFREHPKAQTVFEQFAPSRRNEYIEWITGAKTKATRDKRIAMALEWIAEGKSRNWKYKK